MTDKLLQKFAAKAGERAGAVATPDEPDIADDLGAFGWLRGMHERAVMLELRKANGNILAVGYSWLERAEFDPSEGITLHVTGRQIRLRGRNLNAEMRPLVRLFQGITRHRVPWVQEVSELAAMRAGKGETVVEAIEW
ncbi:MAG: hypothetical protein ABSG53_25385 [Thermoguttaceae bacterium]|jgi:hypothetical protein